MNLEWCLVWLRSCSPSFKVYGGGVCVVDGQHTNQCSVYCYITELYKDQIVDLLGAKTQLEVREDVRGFTYIQNVTV